MTSDSRYGSRDAVLCRLQCALEPESVQNLFAPRDIRHVDVACADCPRFEPRFPFYGTLGYNRGP